MYLLSSFFALHNGLGHFEFKQDLLQEPSFYCGVTTRATAARERPKTSGRESLPRTTKAKLAPSRHPDHRQGVTAHKVPEVLLAAELGPRAWTLRERYPGACASAPRQKGARTGVAFGDDSWAVVSLPALASQEQPTKF